MFFAGMIQLKFGNQLVAGLHSNIYVCIHVSQVYIYIYIHIYIYIYISVCVCYIRNIYIYVCVCNYILHTNVCMYVYIYMCIYIYIQLQESKYYTVGLPMYITYISQPLRGVSRFLRPFASPARCDRCAVASTPPPGPDSERATDRSTPPRAGPASS